MLDSPCKCKENAPPATPLHRAAHWRSGMSSGLLGVVTGTKETAGVSPA